MSATIAEQQPGGETVGLSCLSKSQQKKLRKREKWLAKRADLRKLEKEKRKSKRKAAAEERHRLGVVAPRRPKLMSESDNKFRVVIDMDFDEFMTDAELGAAAKQLGRIYSTNRHAENPCQLYVSSLKGKIKEKMGFKSTGYKNWDCNMSELDYYDIFKTDKQYSAAEEEAYRRQFIYLTGDAQDDLPDVDELLKEETKIFVIGGLVDHNRHKMLCYERASKKNIQTARLPITKYVKLSQRAILPTVAVFEIMLSVLGSHKAWSETLLETIPKRKIAQPTTATDRAELEPTNDESPDTQGDSVQDDIVDEAVISEGDD